MNRQRLKHKLTSQNRMSEAFIFAALLAFCGGFQDAYTYVLRDKVFANAQTGNVVLMSIGFIEGEWITGLRYLAPLISFATGIFIADNIHHFVKNSRRLRWQQTIILLEMIIMGAVGFFPDTLNLAANCLVSFSCAMQVQSFRTVSGNAYASTMCIGNIRSAVSSMSAYARDKDKAKRDTALYYFGVILVFAVGAAVCGKIAPLIGQHTIWLSLPILLIAFLMVELDREES